MAYLAWELFLVSCLTPLSLVAFALVPGIALFTIFASAVFYVLHYRRPSEVWLCEETVDVMVATCGEPLAMIEASLAAARDMRGPHRTWLLDDKGSGEVESLARKLGVGYLTRAGNEGRKAGGLNAALAKTDGDLVAIFDVDHVPKPSFLEQTCGFFVDPQVGFVQNAIDFRNSSVCWTALATADTAKEYYTLTSCGKDRVGAATLMGSNAVIRRAALDRIGGYRAGLAEDLETSIALHADGWKSAFVPEPLAPGLTPEDYVSFAAQQEKWARGILDGFCNAIKGPFWRLTLAQKFSYLLRFSYRFSPLMAVMGVLLSCLLSVFGGREWSDVVELYLAALMSLMLAFCLIRAFAFSALVTKGMPSVTFRGAMLLIATWPAYGKALFSWLVGRAPKFVHTPKERFETPFELVVPQLCFVILVSASMVCLALRSAPPRLTLAVLAGSLICHLSLAPSLLPRLKQGFKRLVLG